MAFVGKDYVISTGRRGARTFKSKDGLRQFTYPSSKFDEFTKTGFGVNFEKRIRPSGKYTSNVHLDVKK